MHVFISTFIFIYIHVYVYRYIFRHLFLFIYLFMYFFRGSAPWGWPCLQKINQTTHSTPYIRKFFLFCLLISPLKHSLCSSRDHLGNWVCTLLHLQRRHHVPGCRCHAAPAEATLGVAWEAMRGFQGSFA